MFTSAVAPDSDMIQDGPVDLSFLVVIVVCLGNKRSTQVHHNGPVSQDQAHLVMPVLVHRKAPA